MKFVFLKLLFVFGIAGYSFSYDEGDSCEIVVHLQKDKEILEEVFKRLPAGQNAEIGDLIIQVGTFFAETPYVAHTLEIETNKEQLVINLREMDCNTFAENCLAISRTIKSGNLTFEKFAKELQNIRYRDGKINGYPSRLHYFSDWIFDNNSKQVIKSVSHQMSGIPCRKTINFMSTHPESYTQLKDLAVVREIANQEQEISERNTFYIPREKLVQTEDQLKDGDIVGITTSIKGLDIMHVGILVRKAGRMYLMHASSVAEKVIISESTLEEYLLKSKTATGIMVARPVY